MENIKKGKKEMNWKALFRPSEILTAADHAELEGIEKKCEVYRRIRQRIDRDFVTSGDRLGYLQALAADLVRDPENAEIYERMIHTAAMPSHPHFGTQHRDAAARPFDAKIEEILEESVPIVRRVLTRALTATEAELKKTEAREKKEAEAEAYTYSPSGKVQALQARVLELRNAVACKYSHEANVIQNPPPWQDRLKEWL